MLDDLDVLTQRILKVKTTLDDIAEAIRAFKEGSLSPDDMPALSTLDEKAEELLSAYDGNLTEEEKDLVDGYRGEIGDMILSLSRSSPGDAGSGAQSAEQPLSEESVPPDDTQDTTADAQEAGDEQASDQHTGITPADDNESVTGRSVEASTEEYAEVDSNFHPNVAFPDDASLDDFPDMDFYSSQPGHDSPGGFHPGIPPNPNLLEYMLIPYLNEFGSVFFVEIDGLSAPLGEWSWDSDQGIWVFDEYTQPGEFDALPQTGGSNALFSALLLSGLLLAGTGIALSLRKRQPKVK
jgi:LPXTG-motif cell wall-anchored protein